MSDLEKKAIERIKTASEMSLHHYGLPLVCTYSGGKDSDVMLELFRRSGVPYEVHHSHTTADAPPEAPKNYMANLDQAERVEWFRQMGFELTTELIRREKTKPGRKDMPAVQMTIFDFLSQKEIKEA